MKHGSFLPVATKQIKGAPEGSGYLDDLLASRDKQIGKLTQLLQRRASPRDNLNFEAKTVELSHLVGLEITSRVQSGIDFIEHDNQELGKLQVEYLDAKRARVTFKWDTDPGERRNVRLLIWGK